MKIRFKWLRRKRKDAQRDAKLGILFFKWVGDSVAAFVNTLMIFVWLAVGNFILSSALPDKLSSAMVVMVERMGMLIWNWEKLFLIVFFSRITYNAYQIFKYDWSSLSGGQK